MIFAFASLLCQMWFPSAPARPSLSTNKSACFRCIGASTPAAWFSQYARERRQGPTDREKTFWCGENSRVSERELISFCNLQYSQIILLLIGQEPKAFRYYPSRFVLSSSDFSNEEGKGVSRVLKSLEEGQTQLCTLLSIRTSLDSWRPQEISRTL